MSSNLEDLDKYMKESFTSRLCSETYKQLLKFQFPNIKGLDVAMDDDGIVNVIFDETEYSAKEVNDFLQKFREENIKNKTHD